MKKNQEKNKREAPQDGDLLAVESIADLEVTIAETICRCLESMDIQAHPAVGGVHFPQIDRFIGIYLDEIVRMPEAPGKSKEKRHRYGITQGGLKINIAKNLKNMRTLYIEAAVTNTQMEAVAQGKENDWEQSVNRAGFRVIEGGKQGSK